MKTMYVVFWVSLLSLLGITRISDGYANGSQNLEESLNPVVLYWETDISVEDIDEEQKNKNEALENPQSDESDSSFTKEQSGWDEKESDEEQSEAPVVDEWKDEWNSDSSVISDDDGKWETVEAENWGSDKVENNENKLGEKSEDSEDEGESENSLVENPEVSLDEENHWAGDKSAENNEYKRSEIWAFIPELWMNKNTLETQNEEENKCSEWYEYDEELNICYKKDETYNVPVYYWTDMDTNHTYNWNQIWTITVKLDDGNTLTMMDMNLWATNNDITKTDSYGEFYQRWNNAPIKTASTSTSEATYKNYWPWNSYYDNTFRYKSSMQDYWEKYNHYNNLWWWGSDSASNNYGWINNGDIRQGPCPTWYHVPSMVEWKTVLQYFALALGQTLTNENSFTNSTNREKFQNVFKLPFAGYRKGSDASFYGQWEFGCYWSSTPREFNGSYNTARCLQISSSTVYIGNDSPYRSAGSSVRCFKDSNIAPIAYILEFDAKGWEVLWIDGNGKLIQKVGNGTKAQQPIDPTKIWSIFQWWVDENDETFAFTVPVTENKTLYAKWECVPWYVDNWGGCWPIDTTKWKEWTDFYDLVVTWADWRELFTIMDRNLWATESWTWSNSYGYYYQRWNNYWFQNTGELTNTSSDLVDASGYGPNNYYLSSTFITRSSSLYRWDSSDNQNLWWWSGDMTISRLDWTDEDRQWSCPEWYHIPSTLEWKAVREIWCTQKMGASATCSNWSDFRDDLSLPFAGYRYYSSAGVFNQGTNGNYWSSSRYNANYAYVLYFGSTALGPQDYDRRANGFSVRCFKNSQTTKTLTFYVSDQKISSEKLEWRASALSELAPQSPERENAEFVGWFEDGSEEAFEFWSNTYLYDDVNLYAKFECNVWYVETADETACEKIRVDFDANGGKFADGENLLSKEISVVEIPNFVTKHVHTINLTDEWEYIYQSTSINPLTSCAYANWSSGSWKLEIHWYSTWFVQIDWAESLDVSIKYGWSSYCAPWPIWVWTWEHTNYEPRNPEHLGSVIWYLSSFPSYGNFETSGFVVEWNVITIVQSSWCPNYGWYATVSGTGIVKIAEYLENDFDNILQPSREWHDFIGWYMGDDTEFNTWNVSTWVVTKVYAKWKCADGYEDKWWECVKKSSWYSGWWVRRVTTTETHGSADEKNTISKEEKQEDSQKETENDSLDKLSEWQENFSPVGGSFTKEQENAYTFAKENWITTTSTIEQAKMNTSLSRIAMAKMLSYYAINVLWQEPDTSKWVVKFNDVSNKLDKQYDNWVTLAYQLWIMWQNMPNNNFRPNDEVTRAEFVTALSRLVYQTEEWEYKWTWKYYIPHMAVLYNEWVINNTDPKMKEKRWYVMIMLMRTVQ